MLEVWILVLSLATSGGPSISTVTGFSNLDQCQRTGARYVARMNTVLNDPHWVAGKRQAGFTCFRVAPPTPAPPL